MSTPYETPVVTRLNDDPTSDSVETHPAYGQISAARVQGHSCLYGSDFDHQHFVIIEIHRSELHRGLNNDWPFARRELIEVALSEAQWAAFVSSLNAGRGTQCTLRHIDGHMVPQIPEPPNRHGQFGRELAEKLGEVLETIDRLRKQVEAGGKIGKRALLAALATLTRELAANLPFVAKQFAEHMERTTESAKVEVNAYITATVQRAGLAALGAEPPIALPNNDQGQQKVV